MSTREILLVEDSPAQAAVYSAYLDADDCFVQAVDSGEAALEYVERRRPAAIVLDMQLPGIQGLDVLRELRDRGVDVPVVVITGHGEAYDAQDALSLGAVDFVTKPFGRSRLKVTIDNAVRQRELASEVRTYRQQFARERFHGFIGRSLPMQSLYRIVEAAAPSRATVFVTGESGTGKELCAAAIHAQSPRRDGPFVAVNCAALPRDLMESEIFGHVKGAFTGAHRQRDGAASLAHGGTLFLDEIGEMDLDLQSKLLRFVQTGQFQRVGSGELQTVDVRIVCATNRDPLAMVRQGRFREDLYYRLHVVPVHLPPLRERGDDVLTIARTFLQRFSREEGKRFERFAPETEQALLAHAWPGNVRELENVVRNVVVLNDCVVVGPEALPPTVRPPAPEAVATAPAAPADLRATAEVPGCGGETSAPPTAAPLPTATPLPTAASPRPAEPLPGAGSPAPLAAAHAAAPSVPTLPTPVPAPPPAVLRPLWEIERDAIEAAIAACDGNVPRAAAALEISPSTIYRKRQAWTAGDRAGDAA